MKKKRNWFLTIAAAIVIGALWLYESGLIRTGAPQVDDTGGQAIVNAFREQRSDVWVSAGGAVQRTLADDNEGSRHQRFIVRLESGHTVMVAHNIDLAPRVPLQAGDLVVLHGEYEWNDRGGVVHWTHHDPKGRRQGGWIEHRGRRYE